MPEPSPELIGTSLGMVEALEWAADYCARNKLLEVPTKSNGYQVDGMKPPTVEERVRIIRELAVQVTEASKDDCKKGSFELNRSDGLLKVSRDIVKYLESYTGGSSSVKTNLQNAKTNLRSLIAALEAGNI